MMRYVLLLISLLGLSVVPQRVGEAQPGGGGALNVNATPVNNCSNSGYVLYNNAGILGCEAGSGTGTVTSVGASTPNSTLTLGGTNPVTGSGTISIDINLSHANSWSGQQTFVAPVLGTPASGNATNLTSIPVAQASGVLPAANGGAGTINGALKGNGSGTVSQAAAADLSNGVTGSGAVVLATSPTLVTPALGTPASGVGTNLTGIPTTALTGTVTDPTCATWDSTTAVTAQTIDFPVAWSTYTITSVKAKVAGGGSFTYAIKIGGTGVTSCNVVTVNSSSNVNTTCTAANTGSANDIVSVVIASPSGTVNQAYVCPVFTHTVS